MVDIRIIEEFKNPVTLNQIKENPKMKNIKLIQRGNRLSVMPVAKTEWNEILKMGDYWPYDWKKQIISIKHSLGYNF